VSIKCTGDACAATQTPFLVKGSLLSPVAITPAYADGPDGHDTPGCAAAAQNPSWTLSNIVWTDETGEAASSTFTMLLTNTAIKYQASCLLGGFDAGPATAPTRVQCTGEEFGSLDNTAYHLSTTASLDPTTFKFDFNQTWYCDDANPGAP
jgi:hypothetical protein